MDVMNKIRAAFARRGGEGYGEGVSQLEHAVQCAAFAQRDGASPTLVAAAYLHDIGHLLHDLPQDIADSGVDTQHEATGSAWLSQYFGPELTEPVRMHVAAKRYLAATEPGYFDLLSDASKLSLTLQGGPMSAELERTRLRGGAVLCRRDPAAALGRRRQDRGFPGAVAGAFRGCCRRLHQIAMNTLHQIPRIDVGALWGADSVARDAVDQAISAAAHGTGFMVLDRPAGLGRCSIWRSVAELLALFEHCPRPNCASCGAGTSIRRGRMSTAAGFRCKTAIPPTRKASTWGRTWPTARQWSMPRIRCAKPRRCRLTACCPAGVT